MLELVFHALTAVGVLLFWGAGVLMSYPTMRAGFALGLVGVTGSSCLLGGIAFAALAAVLMCLVPLLTTLASWAVMAMARRTVAKRYGQFDATYPGWLDGYRDLLGIERRSVRETNAR